MSDKPNVFVDEKIDIQMVLVTFWVDVFKSLTKSSNQEVLRQRISHTAKGMKTLWTCYIASVEEGEPAHDALSAEDASKILCDLLASTPELSSIEHFHEMLMGKDRYGSNLFTPHERVNLARSFALLPIPSQPP